MKNLFPEHIEDLKKSGIDPTRLPAETRLFSLSQKEFQKKSGCKLPQKQEFTALEFQYSEEYSRFKLFPPVHWGESVKPQKYLQKKGTGTSIYIPTPLDYQAKKLSFIEGEKKTISGVLNGLKNCIGLGGIWNWKKKGEHEPIDEIKKLPIMGADIEIIPDSDWTQKRQILEGIFYFAVELEKLGGNVKIVCLPILEDGKTGLDDFFVSCTGFDTLQRISLNHHIFSANGLKPKTAKKQKKSIPVSKQLNEIMKGWGYEFRFNVVTNMLEFRKANGEDFVDLDDRHFNFFLEEIRCVRDFENFSKDRLLDLVNSEWISKSFDPFEEFFSSLIWDQKERLHDFFLTMKTSNPGTDFFYFRNWLINSIACMLGNDKNENCFVFQGKQGVGKTTFLNGLFTRVPELEKYQYVTRGIDPRNPDTLRSMAENGLINLDELEGLSRVESRSVKLIFSLESIKIRLPFGRFFSKSSRRASFCGTVNDKNFLEDETGNRRWLVVEALSFDRRKWESFDINQIWAEAYHLYKLGTRYWFDDLEIQSINKENEKYIISNPAKEMLSSFAHPPEKATDIPENWLTSTEIAQNFLDKRDVPQAFLNRLGKALNDAKYQSKKIKGQKRYLILLKNPSN